MLDKLSALKASSSEWHFVGLGNSLFLPKSWGVGHLLFSAWAGSTSGFSKVPHPQLTPTEWVPLQHRLMGSEAHSQLRGAEGSLGCLCRGSMPPAHRGTPRQPLSPKHTAPLASQYREGKRYGQQERNWPLARRLCKVQLPTQQQ